MSNSLQPHGLQPARLLCPWNSPSKNTGVGCYALLQGISPTQGSNPGLQHCRQILYCLSDQGNYIVTTCYYLRYITYHWCLLWSQYFIETSHGSDCGQILILLCILEVSEPWTLPLRWFSVIRLPSQYPVLHKYITFWGDSKIHEVLHRSWRR